MKLFIYEVLTGLLTFLLAFCSETQEVSSTVTLPDLSSPSIQIAATIGKTTARFSSLIKPKSSKGLLVASVDGKLTDIAVINSTNTVWTILKVSRFDAGIVPYPVKYPDGGSPSFIAIEIKLENQTIPIDASQLKLNDNNDPGMLNLMILENTSFDILPPAKDTEPRTILATFQISSNATHLTLVYNPTRYPSLSTRPTLKPGLWESMGVTCDNKCHRVLPW